MVDVKQMKQANMILHIVQALWTVVLMGVLINSLLQSGPASGAAKFMFVMCWFMIPALIYLTQAPRFQRTQMIAHPYWVMGINSIFLLLWFSGFVSLASYTSSGISAGSDKETNKTIVATGGCALFPAGTGESEQACKMNHAAVGLGVFMWFLWIATAIIAGYAAFFYRAHSVSPFEDLTPSNDIQETTKDAFSSNDEYALIAKSQDADDDEDHHRDRIGSIASYDSANGPVHGPVGGNGRRGSVVSSYEHGRSSSVTSYDTYGEPRYPDAHPGNPVPWGEGREAYGIGGHGPIPPAGAIPPAGTKVGSGGAPHLGLNMPSTGLDMPISPIDLDYEYRGADTR